MKSRAKRNPVQVVVKNGEPTAVILGIEEYRELLERVDDVDDLNALQEVRRKPLKFRKLEEFLAEYSPGV